MTMTKILVGGAGLVALAGAAPAFAQTPLANSSTRAAADRCAIAVQNRLSARDYNDFAGGHSVVVTRVNPRDNDLMVHGVATSGVVAYGPYGIGAYGTLGYAYRAIPDLNWECELSYTGNIEDIDIHRR